MEQCSYNLSNGKKCTRPALHGSESLCVFHANLKPGDNFCKGMQELIDNKDGNWEGFKFHPDFKFENCNIDFEVNASNAKFHDFEVTASRFTKTIIFKGSLFAGKTIFSSVFGEEHAINKTAVGLDDCEFEGDVRIQGRFYSKVMFNRSKFAERFQILGGESVSLSLNVRELFGDRAKVTGNLTGGKQTVANRVSDFYRKITKRLKSHFAQMKKLSIDHLQIVKRYTWSCYVKYFSPEYINNPGRQRNNVFYGEVHLEGVTLDKPELVYMRKINLSRAYLTGVDLSNATLVDIYWYQQELGRQGLYYETQMRKSPDVVAYRYALKTIEHENRMIRLRLEKDKQFSDASDFYVGEMDARRMSLNPLRRYIFSIPALYKVSSNYGTSVKTAIIVFALLVLLHSFLILALEGSSGVPGANIINQIYESLRTLTLQNRGSIGEEPLMIKKYVNFVFSIVGPIQLALVALSLRSKTRRF